jgi:hypothetical protein
VVRGLGYWSVSGGESGAVASSAVFGSDFGLFEGQDSNCSFVS